MDKDLHEIEDLFKSGLENNKEIPSLQVWDSIDNRLDNDKVAVIQKKYQALKRLSLLLLLLVIGLGIYELTNTRKGDGLIKIKGKNENSEILPVNDDMNKTLIDQNQITIRNQNNSQNKNSNTALPVSSNNVVATNRLNTRKEFSVFFKSGDEQKFNQSRQNIIAVDRFDPIVHSRFIREQPINLQVEKTNRPLVPSSEIKDAFRLINSVKVNPAGGFDDMRSQPGKKKEQKPLRFSIAAFFSPDIASYHLEEDQHNSQPETASNIEKAERHEFSSTSGFLFDYSMNKHWLLESGILFSNTNITIQPKTLYAQADNNGNVKFRVNISSGYGFVLPSFQNTPVIGDSIRATAATHKLRYVSIPLALKYTSGKGRIRLESTLGVTINFLARGKLETELQKGLNNEVDILNNIQGLKPVYFSFVTGVGADYRLTKKLSVTLTPTARIALAPINKGGVVKTYPNSLGIAGGLKFRF